ASAGPGCNDPCPCGSGKKYKKCCGANGAEPEPESGEAET
ncbi:MAG TPA: SEC-C metal-binding domain-containing protein, partial [Thauera aminoaromatica]|nr:SEC-C metal-binding domain-containing protein [Thauera aminoaromatica]